MTAGRPKLSSFAMLAILGVGHAVWAQPVEETEEIVIGDDFEGEEAEGLIMISNTRNAIVSVITREEIKLQGYRTVEEILRNTVGFGINQNGHWPDTGIRGINDRTTYGDKIQFLLNGHDMGWRQFNRNFHSQAWVNIDDIDRIEIIRGPGSALWGANALNGVINIITRSWETMNSGEAVAAVDHRAKDQTYFARAGLRRDPLLLDASISYYLRHSDSILPQFREFSLVEIPPDAEYARNYNRVKGDKEEGLTLNVQGRIGGVVISFYKNRRSVGAPLSTFSVVGGNNSRFITDRHIVGLSYAHMLSAGLDLSLSFAFDDLRFGSGTEYEGNPGSTDPGDPVAGTGNFLRRMTASDQRYNFKAQLSWLPTLDLQGIFGAEFEYLDLVRWHFPEVFRHEEIPTPKFTNWHTGLFAQGRYTPFDFVDLSAVVRFDYDQQYGSVLTPRVGAVVTLPAGFSIKAMYGTAFKSPSFHDLYYFRKNAFYGNPDLESETASTAEGQLIFSTGRAVDIKLTGFHTRINNLIAYTPKTNTSTATGDEQFKGSESFPASQLPDADDEYSQKENTSFVTTTGIEVEAAFQLFKRVTLRAYGTYRIPERPSGADETVTERLQYSSEWMAGGSISVRLLEVIDITLRGLAVGDKLVPDRQLSRVGFPTWTNEEDPTREAPAYFVGALVIAANEVFTDRLSLTLKLDNITDAEHWDAGRDVLYPRPKFQGMLWASVRI